MNENQTQLIEINGVKLEVDLRAARRVENIKVGTRVKVLTKEYSGYKVNHGVVIGFEPFEKLPTIIIAIVAMTYDQAKIDFIYFNAETKDVELVVSIDDDRAGVQKEDVCAFIDKEIAKKRAEITDLEDRKRFFLSKFQTYWEPVTQQETEAA